MFGEISRYFTETAVKSLILDELYPKIETSLKTPVNDKEFKRLVGSYIDKNSAKLHTPGPLYQTVFMNEKNDFYKLFNINEKEVKDIVQRITRSINANSNFVYLNNNPILWVFFCAIRYYTVKKDKVGLNSSLVIYAVATYPSVFRGSFKYPPNEGVMLYTLDHLSNKFTMKKSDNLLQALYTSISNSYNTHKAGIIEGSDKEVIRWIQRIHNDQKSMLRYICNEYMENYRKGLRISSSLSDNADLSVDVIENDSSIVDTITSRVLIPIVSNGVNLRVLSQSKDIAGISMSDAKYYIAKIVTNEHSEDIRRFIQSVLFRFLYDDRYKPEDINSRNYLLWASNLFRQTNSHNDNIRNIKTLLNDWAEEVGIHAKFKREATRVNYKKMIFFYFVLSIQYYNVK